MWASPVKRTTPTLGSLGSELCRACKSLSTLSITCRIKNLSDHVIWLQYGIRGDGPWRRLQALQQALHELQRQVQGRAVPSTDWTCDAHEWRHRKASYPAITLALGL